MSQQSEQSPASFDDDPIVSWPDPSPLQSWWDQVVHDHVIPPRSRRDGGQTRSSAG